MKSEFCFCGVAIFLQLFVLGISSSHNVCLTNGCLTAAASFLSNIDASIDPCTDFYQFACGRFLRRSGISPVQNIREESHRILISRLTNLLSEPVTNTDSEAVTKTKQFFHSCVYSDEKDALSSLSHLLKSLGGWPTAEGLNWNEDAFDITNLLTNVISLGVTSNHLFGVRIIEKELGLTWKYGVLINQPFESLDRNLYENATILEAYKTLLEDIAVQLGATRWQARKDVEEMMSFYLKIILLSESSRVDDLETTLMGLWRITDTINWSDLLSGVFKKDVFGRVTVQKIEYFQKLFQHLKVTPKRVIANFVLRSVIDQFLDSLGMASETFSRFYTIISPMWQESRESSSIRCMYITSRYFLHSMTSMYVKKYFRRGQKKAVEEMGLQIREELADQVNSISWLQIKLKQQLKNMISKVSLNVGFDYEILYPKRLNDLYAKMNTTSSSFFFNSVMAHRSRFDALLSKLNQEVDRSTFVDPPPITQSNAFYFRETNSISFSVPLLTDIYFALDRPKYLNYGSLGSVIGHEFIHTIDYLDETFAKSQWWDMRSKINYESKRVCFLRQYQKYIRSKFGIDIDFSEANIENIADSSGLELALWAYDKQQIIEGDEEQRLPGLNLSPRQLFWVSFANVWCLKEDSTTLQESLKNSSRYGITHFRVNGPLSNVHEFAEDFQCPTGSPMNPKLKCSIW